MSSAHNRLCGFVLAITASFLFVGPALAQKAPPGGWFYIQKYIGDRQRTQLGGIASAPIFVFSESGALVDSGTADGAQPYGTLIPVPAGTYYVAGGKFNLGQTRQRYVVRPGKVTVIQTGFVVIETWPEAEQPRQGCSGWDAEMTLYADRDGMTMPIVSNSRFTYATRHLGMIQMLVGKYRLGWHGFDIPVEIKAGMAYTVPLGTIPPQPESKGRVSRTKDETSDNLSLRLCDDGQTHLLAGTYWVSYAKPLDAYPYEERVWQQVEVGPTNEPGYDAKRLGPGDRLAKPLLTGPEADPVFAPTDQDLSRTETRTGTTPQDPLGDDIQWNSPP
ncbi:MAG: hypothetical protein RBU45_06410 [Myxococcota bacterium]|nr:hypothetical protein [Myxococcota bacterium]